MPKKTINVRELVEKYQSNCERISDIAAECEKEQREVLNVFYFQPLKTRGFETS
ncbi:MAG: hypothetical protein J5784_03935 [Muribaculaceae bacterium]|nr:hypothetical protein [Muribaculaceae bacterium]